jgi:hypothetical protein
LFRLAQVGVDASTVDDSYGAGSGIEEIGLPSVGEETLAAAESSTAPGAGAAGASSGTGAGLASTVTIAGTTMTSGTLMGITSLLAAGVLAGVEGMGGGTFTSQEDHISEIR